LTIVRKKRSDEKPPSAARKEAMFGNFLLQVGRKKRGLPRKRWRRERKRAPGPGRRGGGSEVWPWREKRSPLGIPFICCIRGGEVPIIAFKGGARIGREKRGRVSPRKKVGELSLLRIQKGEKDPSSSEGKVTEKGGPFSILDVVKRRGG